MSQNSKLIPASDRKRPTFGFHVNWGLTNPYTSPMWWGAVEAAITLDVNLVGYGDINIYDFAQNRSLYRQLQPSTLDGLVLVNPSFNPIQGDTFGRLPMINIGYPMEGVVSSILVDNYEGMRASVRHLIEVHGCRRLAFIKGPVNNMDADERYQAFVEELDLHEQEEDLSLLYQPFDWSPPGGKEAVQYFLDERKVKFDGLICANDNMALAAMAELQARGIRIPYDISVSGFDDSIEFFHQHATPDNRAPALAADGRLALEALMAHHQGKSVPEKLILPTTLLVRRSCGCLSDAVSRVNEGMQISPAQEMPVELTEQPRAGSLLEAHREVILGEVKRAMTLRDIPTFAPTEAELLDSLITSLDTGDNGEAFLTSIDLNSRRLMEQKVPVGQLQDVLSALRREGCRALAGHPALMIEAENLWHRARVFLNELVLQQQIQKRVQLNEQMAVLRAISQTMAVTFHLDNLMDILARDLDQLVIEGCYVALYEGVNRPAEWARLVLTFSEGRRMTSKGRKRYPTARILPVELWGEKRRTFVLEALEFQSEEIGFVLFEVGPQDGAVYEALRSQLGSSIKGALLFDERDLLLTKTTQLYRQAATGQRLAEEANRLKSRFLSMVSHELRTPLNLITGLSELLLKDTDGKKPVNFDNLKLVNVTAQHLDGLIRDVLDLARDEKGELRLICEPLDLVKELEAVVIFGRQLAREHGLEWSTQVPAHLPLVWGDPTRLRQVVLNLINNSVKFTEKGSVSLEVSLGKEMITLSVIDTGLGIPPGEQGVIFDEFRQSDRTTARGFGGLGLGLAICKRLVEMHGGEIGVRSSGVEGEGATFFFTLPTLQAVSLHAESTNVIWILTTQPENGEPLKHYLEEQGFETEILPWDEEGQWLARSFQSPPAAVIVDIYKSRKHGLDAMRSLKSHPSTSGITVLFYSLQVEKDSGAMLELDYLTKPIAAPELAKSLQRAGWNLDPQVDPEESLDTKTILIVDDDPGVLELHAQIVHTQFPQYRVVVANNGKEALQLLQTGNPDLVLLDLMMPEMDGFGVLEEMQKMDSARHIPVIVISAKTLTGEEIAGLNRSVAAVLRKGMFTSTETMRHIKDTLVNRQKLGSEAQRLTRKAMSYIHEHYTESLGREDVARHVGVSEGYLSRCFTQETGLSLVHYITRYRIQQAKHLLTTGNMTITEIAMEVGFSDSNYFSRTFRREVGLSPLAYRRMH